MQGIAASAAKRRCVKRKIIVALLLAALTGPLSAHECKHGFWIFGRRHIYISHKPEIGSACHGYQVILEVALEPGAADTYRALEAKKGEMTIEFPKHFLLEDIKVGQLMPVKATLHEGNYEDNNLPHHVVLTNVPVRVVSQIVFRKLSVDPDGSVKAYLFGTPEELYMANQVNQNPDFDEIVQVEMQAPTGSAAYPLAGHKYAAGQKPEVFLKEGETGDLQDGASLHPYRVLRKIELTFSNDAFAASH